MGTWVWGQDGPPPRSLLSGRGWRRGVGQPRVSSWLHHGAIAKQSSDGRQRHQQELGQGGRPNRVALVEIGSLENGPLEDVADARQAGLALLRQGEVGPEELLGLECRRKL